MTKEDIISHNEEVHRLWTIEARWRFGPMKQKGSKNPDPKWLLLFDILMIRQNGNANLPLFKQEVHWPIDIRRKRK